MKNTIKSIMESFDEELYVGLGATAFDVSMADGKVTDGTIAIRDRTIKNVRKLVTSSLKTLLVHLENEIEGKRVIYPPVDTTSYVNPVDDGFNSGLSSSQDVINSYIEAIK